VADVEFRDILWQVQAELPGVPMPQLFYNYFEVVRDFCTRTKCWNYNSDAELSLAASTAWPTITAGTHIPANTYVVEPTSVKWDTGRIITFRTRDQLDKQDGDWELATAAIPNHWTVTGPKQWRIYPLLSDSVTTKLVMRFAIAPIRTKATGRTGMPEELVYEFQDLWGMGTMARLMKQPGNDWSNPRQAAAYSQQYELGVRTAKSRAAADYGRPDRTVVYAGLPIGGGHPGTRNSDDYGQR
jgi:hypothetical protein